MPDIAGSLTRRVPARTKTERFTWIRSPWMKMSQKYRDIRAKTRSPMDMCFWCRRKFEDGDTMNLAGRPKGKNILLCNACVQLASDLN